MPAQSHRQRICLALLACALSGCGAGPPATPAAAASSNLNLNGNWLLVGTLPFTGVGGTPLNPSFGVAGTFNVIGNTVEAALTTNLPCGASASAGPGAVIAGSIAADGSFAMQTNSATALFASVALTGNVPANSASTWNGHMTFSNNSTLCPANRSVSITAVPIANVTGTYTGVTTLNFFNGFNLLGQPNSTFTLQLQQGGTLPGSTAFDANVLSGTVSVQGVSCFSSGTILVPQSGVLGSEFEAQATMNDGSAIEFLGQILDAAAAHVSLAAVSGSGSACGTFSSPPFTATRQ